MSVSYVGFDKVPDEFKQLHPFLSSVPWTHPVQTSLDFLRQQKSSPFPCTCLGPGSETTHTINHSALAALENSIKQLPTDDPDIFGKFVSSGFVEHSATKSTSFERSHYVVACYRISVDEITIRIACYHLAIRPGQGSIHVEQVFVLFPKPSVQVN